jgi:hypothetical protein
MISFVSVVPKHGSFENFRNQTLNVCCHCEMLDANRSSDQTCTVAASWARRIDASSWKRPLRLALTEFEHINKHMFVRMWKKFTPASGSSTPPRRTQPKQGHPVKCNQQNDLCAWVRGHGCLCTQYIVFC